MNILKYMEAKGFSYRKLGSIVGLSSNTLFRYNKGVGFPKNLQIVQDVAAALDVSVEALLIDENDRFFKELGMTSERDIYDYAYSKFKKKMKEISVDEDGNPSAIALQKKKEMENVKAYQRTLKNVGVHFQRDYYDTYIGPSIAKTGIPVITFIRMAIEEKILRDGLLDEGLEFPPINMEAAKRNKTDR